jgi:ribosomal protein S17
VWADLLTRWAAPQTTVKRLLISGIPHESQHVFPRLIDVQKAQDSALSRNRNVLPTGFAKVDELYQCGNVVWIPDDRELIIRLLVVAHAARGGHRGVQSTRAVLRERFAWTSMDQDVKDFVSQCLHCQWVSASNPSDSRPLRQQIHGTRMNEVIHFDFLFVGLSSQSAYVMIIKEDISGYVWLIPCTEPTAAVAVDALSNWFSTFGVAPVWVSDQGSHFRNKVVDGLRNTLHTRHRFTHPYCAWSNGTVERVCRELLRLLRVLFSEHPGKSVSDWPQFIRWCQLILNGTHRASIGTTPMKAFIGKDDSPLDAIFTNVNHANEAVPLQEIRERHKKLISDSVLALDELHKTVIYKRTSQREAQIKAHNARTNVTDPQFAVGDFVMVAVALAKSKERTIPKLAVRWKGPCRIIRVVSNTTYEIENIVNGSHETLHYAQLRIYSDDALHVTELLTAAISSNEARLKEYKIQNLLALRASRERWEVQVKWTGYQTPTWEPVETIRADVPEMFAIFLNRLPRRQRSQLEKSLS